MKESLFTSGSETGTIEGSFVWVSLGCSKKVEGAWRRPGSNSRILVNDLLLEE